MKTSETEHAAEYKHLKIEIKHLQKSIQVIQEFFLKVTLLSWTACL